MRYLDVLGYVISPVWFFLGAYGRRVWDQRVGH